MIRGIIFSAPMVQALLRNEKFQTRRLADSPLAKVEPGDKLYVRETARATNDCEGFDCIQFAAGGAYHQNTREFRDNWTRMHHYADRRAAWVPSIHMPRWASRLTLDVYDKRFQRLQDITDADAILEGVTYASGSYGIATEVVGKLECLASNPRDSFHLLWDSLHDKEGERWDDNPEIVALTFDPLQKNVDRD